MNDALQLSDRLDFAQVLPVVVDSMIGRIHTAMIGRVDSYNVTRQVVDVTPLVNRVAGDGTVTKYKRLADVPVHFPTVASGGMTLPIAKGDYGLLIFAERSTDEALSSGDQSTPSDPRRYHLSDGFFIPGLMAGSLSPRATYADAVEISCGQVRIVLRNGKIAIGAELPPPFGGSTELLSVLCDTLQALATTTVLVAGSPVPLSTAATFATLKMSLELIRGEL